MLFLKLVSSQVFAWQWVSVGDYFTILAKGSAVLVLGSFKRMSPQRCKVYGVDVSLFNG